MVWRGVGRLWALVMFGLASAPLAAEPLIQITQAEQGTDSAPAAEADTTTQSGSPPTDTPEPSPDAPPASPAPDASPPKQSDAELETITVKPSREIQRKRAAARKPTPGAAPAEPQSGGEQASAQAPIQPITFELPGTAWGPVNGYVATNSATGTKTDTPLIETPASISVVTSDQMQARAVENLAQALRYTPGVSAESFGLDNRGYGLQIRGFSDSTDSMFYRDGLPMKASAFASSHQLSPYGAERIEVLKGPASVLYGQGEPGGIINYVSKRPTLTPFHEVEVIGGNFDHLEGRFDLSGPAGQGSKWSYRLSGLGTDSSTQVDFVDYDKMFIAPALTFRPNADTTITLLTNYQRDNTGWAIQFYPAYGTVLPNPNGKIPSRRFLGEPNFDYYDLTQYALGYQLEHRVNQTWTVRQNLRWNHFDNSQRGVFGFGFEPDLRTYNRYGDGGESDLDGFAVDNQAQAKFATGPLKHKLLLGLDYQRYVLNDLGFSFDGPSMAIDIFDPSYGEELSFIGDYFDSEVHQRQTGVYAQDQISLNNRWFLQLGGRRDFAEAVSFDRLAETKTKQDDNALTGRAGIVYVSRAGLAPYFSYTQSFLPVLGVDVYSQPYDPETGQQYEAGVKYEPPGVKNVFVTFAAFDITRQNVLTSDPNNPVNQIQNGEVGSRGIEVEATASLDWGLNLTAAYTALDTEFIISNDGNEGNTPYGVPDHRASLWADYTMKHGRFAGFGFGAGVRYIAETWGDDANTFKVPAVTLADAAIHYERGSYRLALNANNVFDEEYIASCFTAEFGCNFGERRIVLGTLRYRW